MAFESLTDRLAGGLRETATVAVRILSPDLGR